MMRDKENKLELAWTAWRKDSSDENLSTLLEISTPVLTSALQTYTGGTQDPILTLEAKRLAIEAFPRYDPKKASLSTYLMQQLQPLTRALHERASDLKLPQQVWFDSKNLNTAYAQLEGQLGRMPSQQELADKTGLSLKRLGYLEQFKRTGTPESVLREHRPEEFFSPAVRDSTELDWWAAAVYASLSPIDQIIFDHRCGAHGKQKLTNKKIADLLHVTPAAISQRVTMVVNQLKEGM